MENVCSERPEESGWRRRFVCERRPLSAGENPAGDSRGQLWRSADQFVGGVSGQPSAGEREGVCGISVCEAGRKIANFSVNRRVLTSSTLDWVPGSALRSFSDPYRIASG